MKKMGLGAIVIDSGAIHKKGSKSSMDLLPFFDKVVFVKFVVKIQRPILT